MIIFMFLFLTREEEHEYERTWRSALRREP